METAKLHNKLELMKSYCKELQAAILWHESYMSWMRQRGSSGGEYQSVYDHCTKMAEQGREDRNYRLSLARKLKNKIEELNK